MKSKILILFSALLVMMVVPLCLIAQESISFGDTVEGTLEAGARASYAFDASTGDYILVSLNSADFDTYLYLLNSSDEIITSDDDGGADLNSLINGFIIPEDGTYIIQAASFDDNSSGDFTLQLDKQDVRQVEYGQSISEANALASVYTFEGSTGDLIIATISAESGLETTIELQDPNGFFVASGSYIDGQNSRLGPTILNEDGTYLLATRADDAFTLTLSSPEPTEIVVDETQTGTFSEDAQTLYFILENDDSRILDFIIESDGQLDTQMELISPFGYTVMAAQDSDSSVDPSVIGSLIDEIGTYYLVVTAQNPNATLDGEISLTVSISEVDKLESGPKTLQFNFTDTNKYLTLDGTAGESLRLRATIDEAESFSIPTISLYQGDVEVMFVSFNGLKAVEFDVTPVEDGEITVIVQAYSEVTMTLELITAGN